MPVPFRYIPSLVLLAVLTAPLHAQDRERGPLILELPSSTRALALGDAFQLASRDPDAVFYHPGRIARAQGLVASLQRFNANGTLTSLSAGLAWFGGGVALGIQSLAYEAPARAGHDVQDILDLSGKPFETRSSGQSGHVRYQSQAVPVSQIQGVRVRLSWAGLP